MIDPVTAIGAATAAFNGLQKMVKMGRDFEDCIGQISKWAGAASDIAFLDQQSKNPPWYATLSGSAEAKALEIHAAQEKLARQRAEILTIVRYAGGEKGKDKYLKILREVKEQRRKHAYRKIKIKQAILEWVLGILAFVVVCAIAAGGFYLVGKQQGKW